MTNSRSVQRRIAAQKGLPAPQFDREQDIKALAETIRKIYREPINTFSDLYLAKRLYSEGYRLPVKHEEPTPIVKYQEVTLEGLTLEETNSIIDNHAPEDITEIAIDIEQAVLYKNKGKLYRVKE